MRRGKWIALSGIDGAGKTTQLKYLYKSLSNKGYKLKIIAQLDTDMGYYIKNILKLNIKNNIKPQVRALIFSALNYYLWGIIENYLNKYDLILTDRSVYCAFAYSGAQNLFKKWIKSLYIYCPYPDLTIFIDVPVNIAHERKGFDKLMPKYDFSFLEKVRNEYLKMVKLGYIKYINGNKSINQVTDDIIKLILAVYKDEV